MGLLLVVWMILGVALAILVNNHNRKRGNK